jgi:signal transduction histidine kinase
VTRRQQVGDAAIVAAIALGCTFEVWAPGTFGSTHMTGPPAAVYASYVVAIAALAFRRRYPLGCALVVAGALSAEWLAFGSPEGFGVFTIPIVAGYSVAANAERGRALIGLGALLLMAALWTVRDPMVSGTQAHFNSLGWLSPVLIAWLIGAYVRELRDRTSRAVRDRDERAAAAVVSERARIARELHDIVAHNVSVMVVQAEAADEMLDLARPDRAREPVQRIQATGRAALTDMRRLLGILRESDARPDLGPQPGIANLDVLLAKVREAGLPVELEIAGEPAPLPPGVDLSAYRIVQEALTNALRYAGPARARVRVAFVSGALELEVSDDGNGARAAGSHGGGHGLVGMAERVAVFGGVLEAGPGAEGGYLVRARLPLGDGA